MRLGFLVKILAVLSLEPAIISPSAETATAQTDIAGNVITWTQFVPFHILTVRSSPELTISPEGKTAREYMKESCPDSSAISSPFRVQRRMTPSFVAEAISPFVPCPCGSFANARTTSLPSNDISILPLTSKTRIARSAHPRQSDQSCLALYLISASYL